ncbi:MAG: response regulator [Gammaproteobacteria bacterium]|nr:response regulator [Gammaproteobacteria bacterium]
MKKILAVDDTEIMLDIIKLQLEKEGYEVHTNTDPQVAMQRIASERFDLILLDIMMPGINGLEILKFTKQQEINQLTPVVMLTANEDMNSVRDCLTNGALEYITKPFNIVSVKKRVAQIFNQDK